MLRFAMIATLMLLATTGVARASDADMSVQIDWNPDQDVPENALWLAYLMSRAKYITDNKAAYEQKRGVVTPLFAEELAARTETVQVYLEHKEKDAQLKVAYFDDLARVAGQSFMGEYVWTYLYQPEWGTPPKNLRMVDFMNWRSANLAQHVVLTKGEIRLAGKAGAKDESSDEPPSAMALLSQGVAVLRNGDPPEAIAGYFDPVIEHFGRLHRDPGTHVYAASNMSQVLLYSALPHEDKKPVSVLDSTWSDAYLLKAYALIELHKLGEAKTALESAISLSPSSSQYLSELAYLYQAQGQCEQSIATYEQAEQAANLGSDESTKVADLTRAWRGQGYCLVELDRFDEAEKLYKKCLALDPSDGKAKSELEYVKKKRR